jgi:hypothetical protein
VGLSEYLAAHPASMRARVQTGAWNVGATSGLDLSQWVGSPGQREGVGTVQDLSRRWWALRESSREPADALERARRLLLEAQTSCYLFWGDDWLPKLKRLTDAAAALIRPLEQGVAPPPAAPGKQATTVEAKPGRKSPAGKQRPGGRS